MKSPQSYLSVVLLLALAGVAVVTWRQHNELVDLRTAAMKPDERADMQKKIWDLEKSNRDLRDRLASAPAGGKSPAAATAPRAAAANASDNRSGAQIANAVRDAVIANSDTVRTLLAQPDVQAAIAIQRKLAAEQRYGAFVRSLGLPPAQADKLLVLLSARMNVREDVRIVAFEQGMDPLSNPDGLRQLMVNSQADINQSLQTMLGADGMAKLQGYDQTQPQRTLVDQLQQRLVVSDTPLTLAQADQLAQILANNKARPPAPAGAPANGDRAADKVPVASLNSIPGAASIANALGTTVSGPAITPEAVAQAQTFLSASQLAALQQMQQQQQAAQHLQQAAQQIGASVGGAAAPKR